MPIYYGGYGYVLLTMIVSLISSGVINSRYQKYRQVVSDLNLTGAEVAKRILNRNNIGHMDVRMVSGELTDHFDPRDESISLSRNVYSGTSIASIAVAAHEVGHAIQYSRNYIPLKLRSALVPVTNFATQMSYVFIMLGLFINPKLVDIGLIMFGVIFLFQVVTLPVEINASRRAMNELDIIGVSTRDHHGASQMLKAAAFTYIAAMVTALLQLLRVISIFGNRENNRR